MGFLNLGREGEGGREGGKQTLGAGGEMKREGGASLVMMMG